MNLYLFNPGAEEGNTSGWTNPADTWHVVSSASAPEGSHYFETNEYSNLLFDDALIQRVDLRQYSGSLEDVFLNAYISARRGYAETSDGLSWNYTVMPFMNFSDSNGHFLEGIGVGIRGTDNAPWYRTAAAGSGLSDWLQIRDRVAFIDVSLAGIWINNLGEGAPGVPVDSILYTPDYTRFDQISLQAKIPEPAALGLILLAAVFFRCGFHGFLDSST